MDNSGMVYLVIIAMFVLVVAIVGLEMVRGKQKKEIKRLRKELADLFRDYREMNRRIR